MIKLGNIHNVKRESEVIQWQSQSARIVCWSREVEWKLFFRIRASAVCFWRKANKVILSTWCECPHTHSGEGSRSQKKDRKKGMWREEVKPIKLGWKVIFVSIRLYGSGLSSFFSIKYVSRSSLESVECRAGLMENWIAIETRRKNFRCSIDCFDSRRETTSCIDLRRKQSLDKLLAFHRSVCYVMLTLAMLTRWMSSLICLRCAHLADNNVAEDFLTWRYFDTLQLADASRYTYQLQIFA